VAEPTASGGATESGGVDWNGPEAAFWVDHDERYDRILAPHGEALLDAAAPRAGERVLDVGCGRGTTTLPAARAVGPETGTAAGIDISRAMIDRARSRAARSGVRNVRFDVGDAQTADLGSAAFDLAISRHGVMFFADHAAAFGNIRTALRPGGRLVFVCWAPRERNEYWTLPFDVLAPHLGWLAPAGRPDGPFALADPDHVETVLARAGWNDISIREVAAPLCAGRDADDAVAFESAAPSVAADLASVDPAVAARATGDLRAVYSARQRHDGVWLASSVWLVEAVAA
jgi:SAM-dependent methyltransferase